MLLFKRRDTRFYVLALGGFVSLFPLVAGLGTPAYTPVVQFPLAILTFAVVTAAILWWRRALPPDVELTWINPSDAARLLAEPAPPDATRVFIVFERDWLRRYRLDVLVDGQHAGQLPPGTGMLLKLQPGPHTLQVFLDRPRTATTELINSIPGGDARYTVRNHGSRTIDLELRRIPGDGPLLLKKGMRLVQPTAKG